MTSSLHGLQKRRDDCATGFGKVDIGRLAKAFFHCLAGAGAAFLTAQRDLKREALDGATEAIGTRLRLAVERVVARWLHAGEPVGPQFHSARQTAAGEPALSTGVDFTDPPASGGPVPQERGARVGPGRYRWTVRVLRAAGRQGDPLRRDRRRGWTELVRRCHGWPQGAVAGMDSHGG